MNLRLFLHVILCLGFFTSSATAKKTASELLAVSDDPKVQGLAIFQEMEDRDRGFKDMEVKVTMKLFNAQGEVSERSLRNKTFEIQQTDKGDKTLIIFDQPRDLAGTAFLTFSNILTPDDQWLYLPSLKRVKRIASKNKSGPFMGSEFAYEDISSQEVGKYDYKYIKSEACGALECFVVERYPLYEHSGYTKQVGWVDKEEFRLIKVDFYDRKHSLFKTLEYKNYKLYSGRYWRADEFLMVNHQTGKKTQLMWQDYRFNIGLKESDFVQDKLKNVR